jgi:hypothetical protein
VAKDACTGGNMGGNGGTFTGQHLTKLKRDAEED